IHAFQLDCALLVCGFDARGAYILSVDNLGIVTDMTTTGFHAIGSGYDKATARLLFSEFTRAHPLHRMLFDTFDAKAFAEMDGSVGYDWDAKIAVKGTSHDVPKPTKELIEQVWVEWTRSPFKRYNPNEDIDQPPVRWEKKLKDYAATILPDEYSPPI